MSTVNDTPALLRSDYYAASDVHLLRLARYLGIYVCSAWRHKHLADAVFYGAQKAPPHHDHRRS